MILDFGHGFFLRPARPDDHAALCTICLRTGDAGKDAASREDDPSLMGQIYAVPYQVLEPDFAFVIDSEDGVAGYLFGALDTRTFNARLAADWYPPLRQRIADPGPDRSLWRNSDWARHAIHHPNLEIPAGLAPYPSHGHIDLLPQARGQGIGRRCMSFLEGRLAAKGSTGLFLNVHPQNIEAQRFYAALGYETVSAAVHTATSTFMAKLLSG